MTDFVNEKLWDKQNELVNKGLMSVEAGIRDMRKEVKALDVKIDEKVLPAINDLGQRMVKVEAEACALDRVGVKVEQAKETEAAKWKQVLPWAVGLGGGGSALAALLDKFIA